MRLLPLAALRRDREQKVMLLAYQNWAKIKLSADSYNKYFEVNFQTNCVLHWVAQQTEMISSGVSISLSQEYVGNNHIQTSVPMHLIWCTPTIK
jgi:hypothetical protein